MNNKETTFLRKKTIKLLRNIHGDTSDLFLVHCGHQICEPGYQYSHKKLDEYHLHFILKGKGVLYDEKRNCELSEGDIFVLFPNSKLKNKADNKEPWEYIWVTFNGTHAQKYLSYAGLTVDNPFVTSNDPVRNYIPFVERILNLNRLTRSNEIRRIGILYELLADLVASQSKQTDEHKFEHKRYVSYAVNYINANLSTVKVSKLAKKIGINPKYLSNIFKEELGVSPSEYILGLKMQKSMHLLTNSNMLIKDIAADVGYGDYINFSKSFKKFYGKSPKKYR